MVSVIIMVLILKFSKRISPDRHAHGCTRVLSRHRLSSLLMEQALQTIEVARPGKLLNLVLNILY